ncbi:endophilin-A3-like [Sycon ciliatum]|uniref:endophilin-A3-like n=1 Tax=Sycon ciliatum TaxID=27933 RepID=UPI0031F61708
MSVAGLKNKFAKAGQYMSEKVLKAEHTRKDEEYREMEKAVDTMAATAEHMVREVNYMLQPNPTERMKVAARRKVKSDKAFYPYEEGPVGDVMLKAGSELGDKAINYGSGLEQVGTAMKELADERDNLHVNVTHNFIDPLNRFLLQDIKESAAHRKKMESRRLNFDAKRRKMANAKGGNAGVTEEEVREAEAKFEESYDLAADSMQNLLDAEGEQLAQLSALCEAMVDSHQASIRILENALSSVRNLIDSSASRGTAERRRVRPVPVDSGRHSDEEAPGSSGGSDAFCVSLYDFEPENEGELGFPEGAHIQLVSRIDENWLEGSYQGQTGFFPTNYVEIKKDL